LPLLRDVPSLYYAVWYRAICPLGTKMLPDGTACRVPAGVACYHNRCLPLRDWGPLMVQQALWRRWRHAFDHMAAASQAVKEQLVAEGSKPVDVVWHGVPVRPRRPPLTSPPMVACAARLVPEKGTAVLIRAFAQVVRELPEARLILVGDGPERAHLTRLIAELGIGVNVVLLGHLARAEMERHFQAAWVQAVPSRWAEPFALVTIEAMMRGTAVVASATGGLRDLVRHGETGLLVPPGDAGALAGALLHLLRDRALAERMGAAGRDVARDTLSEDAFVDRFLRLYATMGVTGEHPA
jgi:glycosyltransferase involved in cell wall biosynthesis